MLSIQFLLSRRADLTAEQFSERLLVAHKGLAPRLINQLKVDRHTVSLGQCDVRTACLQTARGFADWPYDALVTLSWNSREAYDEAVGHVSAIDLMDELLNAECRLIDSSRSTARVVAEAVMSGCKTESTRMAANNYEVAL